MNVVEGVEVQRERNEVAELNWIRCHQPKQNVPHLVESETSPRVQLASKHQIGNFEERRLRVLRECQHSREVVIEPLEVSVTIIWRNSTQLKQS